MKTEDMLALTIVLVFIAAIIITLPHIDDISNWITEKSRFSDCIFDEDITLCEGEYYTYKLDKDITSIKIDVVKESGPPVEIVLFDKLNYAKWQKLANGKTFEGELYGEQYIVGDEFSKEFNQIAENDYIVIENTWHGKTYPPQDVTDDISFLKVEISQ